MRMLPRFLRTNVFPYTSGLLVLAKFLAEILDKLRSMGVAASE